MILTPEQLEQCRADFEALAKNKEYLIGKYNDGTYIADSTELRFEGYKAAWRPVPSVEEIEKLIEDYAVPVDIPDFERDLAQAIHRAFGGKNEKAKY